MKRKFLEDLGLEKEVIDKIMAENGSDIEAEKAKTVEATTKLESANSQLKEANNTITNLKKNNSNNEELQTKVKEYENTIKTQKTEYETKVRNLTLDSAINSALTKAKAKHSDLLASKINRDKLVINEDGTVTGLDEQLKGFKDTYKDMFEVSLGGKTPPNPDGKPTTITKEQFNKMGYLERVKLNQDNPELYNSLKGEM
ncbi:phage scaffolding protein [Eubacterium multiforme]|uniref:RNase H-like nuclease (RuvC/YqgF family) n=1 Tax=Eubacterium multiforme TaxID=83339 RepID=A0ABT9UW70_9FIRM|nr:phage scaffolding protein [Eubacterium multiforme]MDQ0150573.1 putative RNase H-like nuclease (RuvC/YqgF family) [Eubacterium multiforme]